LKDTEKKNSALSPVKIFKKSNKTIFFDDTAAINRFSKNDDSIRVKNEKVKFSNVNDYIIQNNNNNKIKFYKYPIKDNMPIDYLLRTFK